MIVNCDAKQLEVNVAAYLSQDPILLYEVRNKVDLHELNRERFDLPSRLIAKKFKFRLIYGGSAYSYAHDPEFREVGYKEKQWQEVIDEYYKKYSRLAEWHKELIQTAISTNKLVMPTGRVFSYYPKETYKGTEWPETTIKNYPVQGTGADIMSIIRVDFGRHFRQYKIPGEIVTTVHDSIVVDTPKNNVDKVIQLFYKVFERMPMNFQKLFNVEYNLPIFCEVSVGPNMKDLIEIT